MTDLHTHILPGMDDGSPDVETSLAMLRAQRDQGVDTVALTSHFYRSHERPSSFLRRRLEAMEQLEDALRGLDPAERDSLPRLVLGSEVAWVPHMDEWPELEQLCYEGTKYILLEPSFRTWHESFLREVYDFMNQTGLTPVIAHIDRYYRRQPREMVEALFRMGIPIQLSAEELLHFSTRGKAMGLLKDRRTRILISDCHNTTDRRPNMGDGLVVVRKKLGEEGVRSVGRHTDGILRS